MGKTAKTLYLNQADLLNAIYFEKDSFLCPSPEFHESIEFIFLLEGRIKAHVGEEEYELSPSEIVFVGNFEAHYYEPMEEKILAYVLVLSREYTSSFFSYYPRLTIPSLLLDQAKNKELLKILESWHNEKQRSHVMNEGYASLFLSKIALLYPLVKRKDNKDHEIGMALLKHINEHYLEDLSLKEVAQSLGYSEEYCSKKLKKMTGGNFREYLNTLRFRKASELLNERNGKRSKEEIMALCGFSSPATFYRAQKRFLEKSSAFKK